MGNKCLRLCCCWGCVHVSGSTWCVIFSRFMENRFKHLFDYEYFAAFGCWSAAWKVRTYFRCFFYWSVMHLGNLACVIPTQFHVMNVHIFSINESNVSAAVFLLIFFVRSKIVGALLPTTGLLWCSHWYCMFSFFTSWTHSLSYLDAREQQPKWSRQHRVLWKTIPQVSYLFVKKCKSCFCYSTSQNQWSVNSYVTEI